VYKISITKASTVIIQKAI